MFYKGNNNSQLSILNSQLIESPISFAFSTSSCISGSRSLGTLLSSTASLRYCLRSPTSRQGCILNICIISLPSITGCSNRL